MTALAPLWNVPGDEDELSTWAFCHMVSHRDLALAVYQQTGVSLPEYILDPIPVQDIGSWVYQHQEMHNNLNQVLGVSGFNLLSLDWNNEGSRSGWIQANAVEHRNAANVLGIG